MVQEQKHDNSLTGNSSSRYPTQKSMQMASFSTTKTNTRAHCGSSGHTEAGKRANTSSQQQPDAWGPVYKNRKHFTDLHLR